jgi:hypothetical protein
MRNLSPRFNEAVQRPLLPRQKKQTLKSTKSAARIRAIAAVE